MALSAAIAQTTQNYVADVKAGKLKFPAFKREGETVIGVWRDTRFEALSCMFGFGVGDPSLLADMRQQMALCTCYLEDRPHLEWPQPRGEQLRPRD
jgi:hypothetical protein